MIKSKSCSLTLAFCEVAALEEYLHSQRRNLETFTNGAAYAASAHGVTIYCVSEKQADTVWNAVLEATDDEEQDE